MARLPEITAEDLEHALEVVRRVRESRGKMTA